MEENGLKITRDEAHPGVLIATIDRPPVNAVNVDFFRTATEFFRDIGRDPKARCVILTGAGRLFSAGADVKGLNDRTTEGMFFRSQWTRDCFNAIRGCQIPVIGAVNGGALGAGLVLASCCDMVVASEASFFGLPEVDVGVMGGTRHAARLLPDKLVRYLALTGQRLPPQELLAMGGINRIVAPENLMSSAFEIADRIARKSPLAIKLMKDSINLTEDFPITEGYRIEQLYTTLASAMDESKEASAAFLEKREPSWVTKLKE
jgi:enoyl-CoA hydratase